MFVVVLLLHEYSMLNLIFDKEDRTFREFFKSARLENTSDDMRISSDL